MTKKLMTNKKNQVAVISMACYRNKHSLKISHPYIEKRVFYRPESSFGLSPFFLQKAIFFATVVAIMLILGKHMYLGQISLQSKFGTVYYQDVYFTDQKAIFKGHPCNCLTVGSILPKISGSSYNLYRKRSHR